MTMPLRPLTIMLALGLLASAPAQAVRHHQKDFDGTWSILVVTEHGNCDRAYRYAVQVRNGAVYYSGSAGVNLHGRVSDNGSVRVGITHGDQSATGVGRLSGNYGSGHWSGRSPEQQCSGRWEAERRSPAAPLSE